MSVAQLMPTALGGDRFTAPPGEGDERRTYGGLIVGQTLAAVAATADGVPCHSLHLLFAGAGDGTKPVTIGVDRLRDGRAFAARGARVEQDGKLLASATLSFHRGDTGPAYQAAMPSAPDPDSLEDQRETRRRNAAARGKTPRTSVAEALIDARPGELHIDRDGDGVEPHRILWFRSRIALDDDPLAHQAMIAFASDMGLVHMGMMANNALGDGAQLEGASLDHTIWFHRPARADQWLLFVQRTPLAHGGRGMTQGMIFTQDGSLVASVAQEVLIRHAQPAGGR